MEKIWVMDNFIWSVTLFQPFPTPFFSISLIPTFMPVSFYFFRPQLCHIQWSFSCPQVGPHKDLAWLLRLMDNFSLSMIAYDFKFGKIMSLILIFIVKT